MPNVLSLLHFERAIQNSVGLVIKKQTLDQNIYYCICELSVNTGSISEAGDVDYTTQLGDWDLSGTHDPG